MLHIFSSKHTYIEFFIGVTLFSSDAEVFKTSLDEFCMTYIYGLICSLKVNSCILKVRLMIYVKYCKLYLRRLMFEMVHEELWYKK